MPNVTVTPRQMGNGDVVSQFIDSVGITPVTYTYPKTQEKFIMRNMGPSSLSVTVAGVTQVIERGEKWQKIADFNSFTINAVSGYVAFDAWADEKGSTFDTAEGKYFQSNGGGSGGGTGSVSVYATLSDLQAALPGGSTSPVWVTLDNSWYYWSGTVTADTTAPTITANPAAGTYMGTQSVQLTANEAATIYYTTDGSTPTESSSIYSSAISVAATSTVKAIAKDAAGNVSTPVSFAYTITVVTIPATPTTPTATPGNNKVDLAWTSVSGATSYKVYRGGTLLANPTTNSYSDTTAVNDTTYSYTVSAVNSAGESAQSSSASATPVAATTTVTDDFNRADNTSSMGTATTGQAWTALAGTWGISGNQAYCSANSTTSIAVVESSKADATIQAKLSTIAATNTRLVFRVVDSNNMLLVQTDTGNVYKLFKQVAGTYTALGNSTGVTPTNGDIVKVVTSGSSVTVYVNNVQVITATCTDHQTATKHGFAVNTASQSVSRFDDFSVV